MSRSAVSLIVTPAKAGVHAGANAVVEGWAPAFAGATIMGRPELEP